VPVNRPGWLPALPLFWSQDTFTRESRKKSNTPRPQAKAAAPARPMPTGPSHGIVRAPSPSPNSDGTGETEKPPGVAFLLVAKAAQPRRQALIRATTRWLPDCRQAGNYPETGLEEINGDLLQADFWPGITSGLPVTRAEPETRSRPKNLARGMAYHYLFPDLNAHQILANFQRAGICFSSERD